MVQSSTHYIFIDKKTKKSWRNKYYFIKFAPRVVVNLTMKEQKRF